MSRIDTHPLPRKATVIGGGPAGLMAAEVMAAQGIEVDVYDAMASVGRKFLLAGKGGMNLTHSEPEPRFSSRYYARQQALAPALDAFGPTALREWARGLGIETFIGTSGRVFPTDMKAAPLLRAWLHRLRQQGVRIHIRHRWIGWDQNANLLFKTPQGMITQSADAIVLALGGGSWQRLGSDGAWVPWLEKKGIAVHPLQPANCGFNVEWSQHLREKFAGSPIKSAVIRFTDSVGKPWERKGEFVISESGLEGSLIYALSAALRDTINTNGPVRINIDLAPDRSVAQLQAALSKPRGKESLASHFRKRAGIDAVRMALLRESLDSTQLQDAERVATTLKSLPVTLVSPRPIDEAISSAGGVPFEALDEHYMLKALPGVFCAGEMLDWEAPTGGYLLTASFATGRSAGLGAAHWLASSSAVTVDT